MTNEEFLRKYSDHCDLVTKAELAVKEAKEAIKQAERNLGAAEHALWLARYDRREFEDNRLREMANK